MVLIVFHRRNSEPAGGDVPFAVLIVVKILMKTPDHSQNKRHLGRSVPQARLRALTGSLCRGGEVTKGCGYSRDNFRCCCLGGLPLINEAPCVVILIRGGGLPRGRPFFGPSAVPADRPRGVRGFEPPGDPWTAIATSRTAHAVT